MGEPIQYGGQAVIEGVMMRGRCATMVAVRIPSGQIEVEEIKYRSLTKKLPFLKWPFLRGTVVLIESMVIGIKALTYSADRALEEEGEELTPWQIALTVAFALAVGIFLFILLPAFLARYGERLAAGSLFSSLLEGVLRVAFFLAYIVVISRLPDIQRVFQYHGAEHKVINAFEAGEELDPGRVKKFSTRHPRCGTSFLLVVMVVAIFVFAFLGKQEVGERIVSRLLLLPVVAGISYEFIKFSSRHCGHPLVRILIAPGLWLQALTTREPDESQIEVAIRALEAVLAAEKGKDCGSDSNAGQTG